MVLYQELIDAGFKVDKELSLPITYKGKEITNSYRADLVVDNSIIIELKAVSELLPEHHMQIGTYLQLSSYEAGILVNFHEVGTLMPDGIHTYFRNDLISRYHKNN
jgi:GxxExxY protein